MSIKKYFRQIPLFFFIAFLGLSVNANATNIVTDAVVLTAITVTAGVNLNFGTFSTNGLAETVSFPSDTGTIAAGANVALLGGEVIGTADLDTLGAGAGAGTTITITLTATNLLNGANFMILTPDCTGPGGVLGVGACTFLATPGAAETVSVGGSLAVGVAQVAGTYAGTVDVIASF